MPQSPLSPAPLAYEPAQYYSHSGELPPAGLFMGLVAGLIVAAVGGVVYGFADNYIRFIYIRVIMTVAFGALLGWAPAWAMLKANVRNTGAIMLMSAVTAAVGYYVCWAAWMWAVSLEGHRSFPLQTFLFSPALIIRIIRRLDEVGAWSVDQGSPITGVFLAACWLVEALIIFFLALVVARKTARNRPFCETCGQWATGPKVFAATVILETADLKQRLESHQFEFVPQLPRYSAKAGTFLLWDAFQCSACQEFNTLSVTKITQTRDKRGRTKKNRKVLVDKLLVATPDLNRIQAKPTPVTPAVPILPAPPVTPAEVPPMPQQQEPAAPPPRSDDHLLDL